MPAWCDGLSLVLQLGILILAASLGGWVFRYWRLPSQLGELAAGVLLGPRILDGLTCSRPEGFACDGRNAVLVVVLTVLAFLVGLETDVRRLRRPLLAGGLTTGVAGLAAGLVAAGAVAFHLGGRLLGQSSNGLDGWGLAVLAAAAASASGSARVLARASRMESPEGRVVLLAAAIDGALAMLLLCTITADVGGPADALPLRFAQALAKTAACGLAIVAAIGVLARQASSRLAQDSVVPAVYGLALALTAGGLCVFLHLSPLLGAYAAGLAIATTELRHRMQERLEIFQAALVPACVTLFGTLVDPTLLLRPRVLLFALAFAAAALAAKAAAGACAARLARLNRIGCCRVAWALLPRGERTLLAAFGGLGAAGALSSEWLTALAVVWFAAGILGPWLAHRAFAAPGAGTQEGFPVSENVRVVFAFPSETVAGLVVGRLIELFEDEGYDINQFNRRDKLYQFARGTSVLGVQQAGAEVVFTCLAAQRDLVHTAMMEVEAGLEQCLRELRKPLDAAAMRRRIQEGRPREAAAATAHLREFLQVGAMAPRLQAPDKAGVVDELLDLLAAQGLLRDRAAAAAAVMERERSLSTGLENGIAIPHGRTDAVDRLVCAVGLKPGGLDFEALDGKPVRIVVLVLAPLRASAPQLQFISLIGQALDERGRAALMACDTPEDMHAVLTGAAAAGARGRRQPALSCLAWQSIALDMQAASKEEALDQLLALCARSGAVVAPDEARRDILDRERLSTTGIEHGLALPHVRTTAVDRIVCAFAISRKGVDFDALDGRPAHFFAMVLMPPSAGAEYTRLLGVLSRALDAAGQEALLAARSSRQVLAILTARGGDGA